MSEEIWMNEITSAKLIELKDSASYIEITDNYGIFREILIHEAGIRKLRDLCNKALGGEYICSKCGIRQDMNPKAEPEF